MDGCGDGDVDAEDDVEDGYLVVVVVVEERSS